MLPIVLNPNRKKILLIGEGEPLLKRCRLIGAAKMEAEIYAPRGEALMSFPIRRRLPKDEEMRGAILFIAGFSEEEARPLAARARAVGALVNTEDIPALCDFHVPSILRRGDLLFAVSTGGRSPSAARMLRDDLSRHYGAEWSDRLLALSAARDRWRDRGLPPSAVREKSRAMMEDEKWLV